MACAAAILSYRCGGSIGISPTSQLSFRLCAQGTQNTLEANLLLRNAASVSRHHVAKKRKDEIHVMRLTFPWPILGKVRLRLNRNSGLSLGVVAIALGAEPDRLISPAAMALCLA